MGTPKLPDYVTAKLQKLSEVYKLPLDQITNDYINFFSSNFVQTDPQFQSDDDRHAYCIRVIWVRYASAPPSAEYDVIPVGYTDPRLTKGGILQSRIYLLAKDGNNLINRTCVCQGERAKLVYDVQLFYAYRTHFNFYNNTFFAVNRTTFQNPKIIRTDPVTILKKYLNVREVKIADTPYSLSRKMENSRFVDEWDLYLIRGIVLRYSKGRRPDETEWGLYVISDDSVDTSTQKLTPDGRIIPSRFTVWTPASQVKFAEDSEILFLGTIDLTEDKEPQMTAIATYPIHAKLIAEVG